VLRIGSNGLNTSRRSDHRDFERCGRRRLDERVSCCERRGLSGYPLEAHHHRGYVMLGARTRVASGDVARLVSLGRGSREKKRSIIQRELWLALALVAGIVAMLILPSVVR
jgi:hypothetical protein